MSNFDADAFAAILSPRQRASDLEGSTLGNWKLSKKLSSSGGFGVVYRARHTQAEMGDAAVKVFAFDANENPEIRHLFSREIGILKKLTDARNVRGVPRIYDAEIESTGLPWIAMQYIDGKPLDAWLREVKLKSGRPSTPQVVQILHDILAALDAVQQFYAGMSQIPADSSNVRVAEMGIVHRDLKPSNVLVEETPTGPRAWVADFGIARILKPARPPSLLPQMATMTVTANALTAEYASPEMLVPNSAADPRSDIFQVGLIGFELLTGNRFWDVWPDQHRKLKTTEYPWWLKHAVRRALQWDRERRFPSARPFLLAVTHPYRRAIYGNLRAFCVAGAVIFLLAYIILLSVQRHDLRQTNDELDRRATARLSDLNEANATVQALRNENTLMRENVAHTPGNEFASYSGLVDGYKRLEDGTASTADVDELRENARSFLKVYRDQPQYRLQEVKTLLGWLDNARTVGRVKVTVRQLQAKTWTSYAIDCGIDANGQSVKATKNVKGDVGVDGCILEVPWDPDITVKVWMHLTDSGYETCWGHFSPIGVGSKEILQGQSGTWREFFADQYGKDFKLGFTIERDFGPLPPLSQ